jgi:hypothetical protein
MRRFIEGVITDENKVGMPGATIFVSDKNGKLASTQARVLTDDDGKFKLPTSFPFINPLSGYAVMMPIGTHLTTKYATYPDVLTQIDFTNENPVSIAMTPRLQDIEEVTVTDVSSATQCSRNGGKWDLSTKTCVMPQKPITPPKVEEKTWWEKNKKIILIRGGSLLLASIIAIIVVTSFKKKN